jgi:hypothetical protein
MQRDARRGVPLCDNWACPAAVSCALHFGRSRAYAAMSLDHTPLRTRALPKGADACAEYRCDKPRSWLIGPACPEAAHTTEGDGCGG